MSVQQLLNENELVLKASEIVSSQLNPSEVINELLKLLSTERRLIKARVLLPDSSDTLRVKYSFGLSRSEETNATYAIGEGITGKVMKEGQFSLVPDVSQEPTYLNKTSSVDSLSAAQTAFIAAPILSDKKPVGVLAVQTVNNDDKLLLEDVNILIIIGSYIQLALKINQLVEEKTQPLVKENKLLREKVSHLGASQGIIGKSDALNEALKTAQQSANTSASVILLGESGTGKEKFARMIHMTGERKTQPFVSVNCAAIPENLLESELFGHEKGSFTGATNARKGRFESAHGGTLFLDEIGDMNLELQGKLLRALQERKIQRIGSEKDIDVDVRIITATHKDIADEVNNKSFRLDLYYRLNVIPIVLPPLRERKGDVKLLALYFLNRANQRYQRNMIVTQDAMLALVKFDWPGNIRQLENVIERMAVLLEHDVISVEAIDDLLNEESNIQVKFSGNHYNENRKTAYTGLTLSRPYSHITLAEKDKIIDALHKSRGNKTQAALFLGYTPRQLQYRIKKLNIENNVLQYNESC